MTFQTTRRYVIYVTKRPYKRPAQNDKRPCRRTCRRPYKRAQTPCTHPPHTPPGVCAVSRAAFHPHTDTAALALRFASVCSR
jgi:hypothetical protein